MSKLLLFGLLWLGAIGIITYGAFLYLNDGQHLSHEKEMYELKNDD